MEDSRAPISINGSRVNCSVSQMLAILSSVYGLVGEGGIESRSRVRDEGHDRGSVCETEEAKKFEALKEVGGKSGPQIRLCDVGGADLGAVVERF